MEQKWLKLSSLLKTCGIVMCPSNEVICKALSTVPGTQYLFSNMRYYLYDYYLLALFFNFKFNEFF